MFEKPFRYEQDCTNSIIIFNGGGAEMAQIIQEVEDNLTDADHAKAQFVVDALNQFDATKSRG